MKIHWNIIDFSIPESLPTEGQKIYFTIAEGEGKPFAETAEMIADLDSLRDIQSLHPNWIIIWKLVPPPPPPPAAPVNYQIRRLIRCGASKFHRKRCEYYENGSCLYREKLDGPSRCANQVRYSELCEERRGDDP